MKQRIRLAELSTSISDVFYAENKDIEDLFVPWGIFNLVSLACAQMLVLMRAENSR